MKETLNKLYNKELLSEEEAYNVMLDTGNGKYSNEELASLLTVYNMRKISSGELFGFRRSMIEMSVKVNLDKNAIDIVGTGGDGKDTFNISTLSCFVVAGAGYKVVKHGNYSASSVSGSSHMMEFFGYKFSNDEKKLNQDLATANVCFLHAPLFHPAMKYIVPVRKALKVRTIFNIMGPLINPAEPSFSLFGTFNKETASLYHSTLKGLDQNYAVVSSLDGYDEVSLINDSVLYEKNANESILKSSDFGFSNIDKKFLKGGSDVKESAEIFKQILEAKCEQEKKNVVIANSALAIKTIDKKKSLLECVEIAKDSLESKKALQTFNALMKSQ